MTKMAGVKYASCSTPTPDEHLCKFQVNQIETEGEVKKTNIVRFSKVQRQSFRNDQIDVREASCT